MDPASYFRVAPLSDFAWPVSYRYWLTAPWGETRQELTVDVPAFLGQLGPSANLGLELWKRGVATATSRDVRLDLVETMCWAGSLAPSVQIVQGVNGLISAPAAPRKDSVLVVLCDGIGDDFDHRQFYIAGPPANWISGRQLTLGGRDAMEAWGLMMGSAMSSYLIGAPMKWLTTFNELLPPGPGNPFGVAFRRVKNLRGCLHTARAPDPSNRPWP